MSKQGVKRVVAALLSDPHFKKAFFANKKKTLKESGFILTPAEMKALLGIRRLDIRLKKGLHESDVPVVVWPTPRVHHPPPAR